MNIPYLRGLSTNTIKHIVYLMRRMQYELGEYILLDSMPN